jgi:hypothetical protein
MVKCISFAGGYENTEGERENEKKGRRRTVGIERFVNITNDFRHQ